MKTFIVLLLATFALAGISRADRILVYDGYQATRTNDAPGVLSHAYYLFDLNTSEMNYVTYGGTGGKIYTTGTASSFVYEPVETSLNDTMSYFQSSSTVMTSPFALYFSVFYGNNEVHALGNFVANVPSFLYFNGYDLAGNGTAVGDTTIESAGYYTLDVIETRASNNSNDSLATATAAIGSYLNQHGYTSSP
jgi:hypothetical protein